MVEVVTYNEAGPPSGDHQRGEGVVLVDTRGRLVWWSAAMEAGLKRARLRWAHGMRCCEALGCAANGGSEDGCLTEHAFAGGDGFEARPWRGGEADRALDASITAPTIPSGAEKMVVFELRFQNGGR